MREGDGEREREHKKRGGESNGVREGDGERERESTKRGEGNLMGWIVMKKVGTKLASEKLSPSDKLVKP
jgi:hypothetical protein